MARAGWYVFTVGKLKVTNKGKPSEQRFRPATLKSGPYASREKAQTKAEKLGRHKPSKSNPKGHPKGSVSYLTKEDLRDVRKSK